MMAIKQLSTTKCVITYCYQQYDGDKIFVSTTNMCEYDGDKIVIDNKMCEYDGDKIVIDN